MTTAIVALDFDKVKVISFCPFAAREVINTPTSCFNSSSVDGCADSEILAASAAEIRVSLRQLAKELGMAPNTFKKYYLEKFPPDRESKTYKGWTSQSVAKIKVEIQGAK
ncbi:hypothetical protein JH101_000614 [Acinetobacter baumannii]|nr:hypothetical protein [Acinetobacter baumannii]